jgi:hypothetical protein
MQSFPQDDDLMTWITELRAYLDRGDLSAGWIDIRILGR